MTLRGRWRTWINSTLGVVILGSGLLGCSKDVPNPTEVNPTEPKAPTVAFSGGTTEKTSVATPEPMAADKATAADRLHQPFAEACTTEINADSGVALPPTFTLARKNTGQLNEAVQRVWNDVRFKTPDGKRQTYLLSLEVTQASQALGTIEILMQPDLAPNHVRNFVALAQLGFYDGLRFDRVIKQQGDASAAGSKLVLLEAGSPVEDADPATSHLGYWLRPEFSETAKHEEGTVGACLMRCEDNAETAACRFYINLTPAPAMDGNFTIFGRITKGIEVARELASKPTQDSDGSPDQGRLLTPVVITKATVRAVPVVE